MTASMPLRRPRGRARDDSEVRAAELLQDLVALPASDPRRAAVRDRVIEAWTPMAHRLAHRYAYRGESLDDLLQTAVLGLIKAVDRFDPQRGVEFAGFAVPTILGELKRHFRDRTWAVRVPRRLQEMRLATNDAHATLLHTLGRTPTVADIAAHLDTSEEAVLEGLEGAGVYSAASLSTPAGPDGGAEIGDFVGADDHGYEITELRLALGPALARLTDRERRILMLRFYGNQTQTQIAGQVGISQMHVSRLITGALAKLRDQLGPDAAP
jgi:RNA polymerase sigma-B factor